MQRTERELTDKRSHLHSCTQMITHRGPELHTCTHTKRQAKSKTVHIQMYVSVSTVYIGTHTVIFHIRSHKKTQVHTPNTQSAGFRYPYIQLVVVV